MEWRHYWTRQPLQALQWTRITQRQNTKPARRHCVRTLTMRPWEIGSPLQAVWCVGLSLTAAHVGLWSHVAGWRMPVATSHDHTGMTYLVTSLLRTQMYTNQVPVTLYQTNNNMLLLHIPMICELVSVSRQEAVHHQTSFLFLFYDFQYSIPFQCFDTVGLATGRAHGLKSWVLVCWWCRFELSFARLIAPVVNTSPPSSLAPIKSRMETFWYWLTQVHLENGC